MTGPEQRILSGYHAISGVKKPIDQWEIRKDKKYSNFDLPELLHNLNLLVEIAEQVYTISSFYYLFDFDIINTLSFIFITEHYYQQSRTL